MPYSGFILEWRVKPNGSPFQKFLCPSDGIWTELEPGKHKRKILPPFQSRPIAAARMRFWKQARRKSVFEFRIGRRIWKK